jgi:hypothetical protein
MHSQVESSALEAFRPLGLQTKVKSWQWNVAKAHLLNSLRETPISTYHDIDLMSGGSSARASLPSADSINPGINSGARHETLSSSRSSRASSAPTVCPSLSSQQCYFLFAKCPQVGDSEYWGRKNRSSILKYNNGLCRRASHLCR